MRTIYFAKWLLLPDHTLLHNAAVSVSGNTIKEVAPRSQITQHRDDVRVNLGHVLLMPGLINVHTHLEEGLLRKVYREEGDSFSSWLIKKNSRLSRVSSEEIIPRIRLGIRELLSGGITTVVDTTHTGFSLPVLRDELIRGWCIREMPFSDPGTLEEFSKELTISARVAKESEKISLGVSPGALFSCSPVQHKALAELARQRSLIWSMHCAESAEELQAFSEQKGDLYFYRTRREPWQYPAMPRGPMHYALTHNLVPYQAIVLHCNYVTGLELSLLKARRASIAIAPRHGRRHNHKEFPLDLARARDIPLCVMTESPEQSHSLSLFDELFFLKQKYPYLPAAEMLRWVTQNPARALGLAERLGVLKPDAFADLLAVRIPAAPREGEDILEGLILSDPDICFVMVNGEEVIVDY